jgi:tetratricopeptide (TPR) repeat protein
LDTSLIYQALEQPSLRKQIPLDELERIQAAYPYFTAAQVLLAKIYQENKDHRYADQLQQAALYAIDRKVLSEYMKGNEEVGKWENGETGLSTGSRTVENGDETIQNEPVRQAQGPPVRQAQGPIQNDNEKQNENELRGESEEEIHEEEKSSRVEMSDFDREILIEAVQSSIELEVGEQEQNDPSINLESPKGDPSHSGTEVNDEIERIVAKDPSELTFGEMMMLKAARMGLSTGSRNDLSTGSGTTQNEKQNQNENELRGESEDEDEEIRLSTNEERTEERGKNFDYLYKLHNGGLAPIDAPNEKEKQKSIIDRFIKLEPKITPGKVSEYNTASNLAKESLEEDFSFATETMAKLFIAQGKFDKAKKVYRKLMELHPEKNVYFAAQLKNLNQNKKQ